MQQHYLGHAGIAELAGIQVSTVRSYKRYGYLPPADAFVDGEPVGWTRDTIEQWIANRPGPGWRNRAAIPGGGEQA